MPSKQRTPCTLVLPIASGTSRIPWGTSPLQHALTQHIAPREGLFVIEFLLALGISGAEPSDRSGFDHQAFCHQLEEFARSHDAAAGRRLGPDTKLGGVFVYCERRLVELKTLLVTPLDDAAGWIEVQKAIWQNDHCADDTVRLAVKSGWTIRARIVAEDGGEVSFQAVCGQQRED